ncbi:MAG: hypothetical protein QOH89_1429 [Pseudonocardiales bacterium]|nr:hypothetical protein [Pseudonocardiales bacterium]MDT4940023.1 hypothetical protein [Pseudonocardiales bacterium]
MSASAQRARRVVYLHIGEPKSATTFLQEVLWHNRAALARQGVYLPGLHAQEHFRATQDLREVRQPADDPSGPWAGEWATLAGQAARTAGVSVISHELLAAATAEQAARAVASLQPAEVHIVLTVRDFGRLLPAEWQETVKHRNRQTWQRWVGRVIGGPDAPPRRRARWFWAVHDTAEVLRRWSADIPAERVHIVTVPRPGGPPELIWERFASVIGVDPQGMDLSAARPNASLGLAEVEALRRLNVALGRDGLPDWFYAVHVKEALAHGVLAQRPATLRPVLRPRQADWARSRATALIADLRDAGYDVVGDLAELLPAEQPDMPGRGARKGSAAAPAQAVLDAAVAALADVLRREYAAPHATGAVGAGWASSTRAKQTARRLASRYAWARGLRRLAWRVGAKSGRRR